MIEVDYCLNPNAWDRYVENKTDAYHYHRWVWKQAIEEAFGHSGHYLAATDGARISGVLPLVAIKSHLFGDSLVSVPFFSYGGVLADNDETQEALLKKASEVARKLGARHIELRQGQKMNGGWHETSAKVTMEVPLPAKADDLWKRISTGLRNKIRKAQKSDLRVEWGGPEAIDHFYPVFAINMRNLGTPVYPKSWFEAICRAVPGKVRVVSLWDGPTVVASAFLVAYRDKLELPWSASVPDSRKKYSHVLMYWTFLEWAIQNGFRCVDLGRCAPGGGTYEFKRHWICEEKPLHWYYWTAPGVPVPDMRPDNKRFKLAIEVWKRLPLAVANQLGPRIVRALP